MNARDNAENWSLYEEKESIGKINAINDDNFN